MTTALYPTFFSGVADGSIDWEALTPRGLLMSQAFAYDASAVYRDDLIESHILAQSAVMTGLSYVDDVGSADPVEWLQIASAESAYHVVLFNDTGVPATSRLLAVYGNETVTGLPSLLSGEDYFLYPVYPGGYFSIESSIIIGPVNTWGPGYNITLGETIGDVYYAIPDLVFDRRLRARQEVCLMPDELDSDQCCEPVIRGQSCA